MAAVTKGKQGTRGQRLIHEENTETLKYYTIAAVATSVVVFGLNFFVFSSPSAWYTAFWVFSAITGLGAVFFMSSMVRSVRNEKNQVIDAGVDLNDPQSLGEYCKDAVILSCLSQLLSLIWSNFIFFILALPAFALFKLWTKILGPWFFEPAPEDTAGVDEKKLRKQQRTKFVRR